VFPSLAVQLADARQLVVWRPAASSSRAPPEIAIAFLALSFLVNFTASEAVALGVGIEAGGTVTSTQNAAPGNPSTAGDASLGVVLEHSFKLTPLLSLEPWIDFQTPFLIYVSHDLPGSYWAFDAGLRIGFEIGPVTPYAGLVGQLLALSTGPDCGECHPPLVSPAFGLGGDLGAEFAIKPFGFGLEIRYLKTLTSLSQGPGDQIPGSVGVVQILGSVLWFF
jgi:hypothetical protein